LISSGTGALCRTFLRLRFFVKKFERLYEIKKRRRERRRKLKGSMRGKKETKGK